MKSTIACPRKIEQPDGVGRRRSEHAKYRNAVVGIQREYEIVFEKRLTDAIAIRVAWVGREVVLAEQRGRTQVRQIVEVHRIRRRRAVGKNSRREIAQHIQPHTQQAGGEIRRHEHCRRCNARTAETDGGIIRGFEQRSARRFLPDCIIGGIEFHTASDGRDEIRRGEPARREVGHERVRRRQNGSEAVRARRRAEIGHVEQQLRVRAAAPRKKIITPAHRRGAAGRVAGKHLRRRRAAVAVGPAINAKQTGRVRAGTACSVRRFVAGVNRAIVGQGDAA